MKLTDKMKENIGIAYLQLHDDHEAVEKALGRPVYTHEFGMNRQGLKDEIQKVWDKAISERIVKKEIL